MIEIADPSKAPTDAELADAQDRALAASAAALAAARLPRRRQALTVNRRPAAR